MNNEYEHTVIFGWNTFHQAPTHLGQMGRRPLVLAGRNSARRLGILDALLNGLQGEGCEPVLFEGIGPEPRSNMVDEAARLALKEGCDMVVGLGGGSVLDAAKAVAAIAKSGGNSWNLTVWGRSDGKVAAQISDPLPVACIPTVAGSGSEANGTGVLYHPALHEKAVFFDDRLLPRLAVVDPALTVTVGTAHTYAGAVDIIAHGIEDYLTQESPDHAQGRRCLRLARLALDMATRATRDPHDRDARMILARLAMEVWDGSYNGPETPWTLHAMAHVLGARLQIGHSFVIVRLLPAWLAFIRNMDPNRLSGFDLDRQHSFLPPLLPGNIMSWDPSTLAGEVLEIYGENGVMPGWPGLTHTDVVRVLEDAMCRK